MVQVRKNHFDDQMASKTLPADGPSVGTARGPIKSFESNLSQTFEQQTPRSPWQDSQGKVGPSKTQSGESDGPPSIVVDKGSKAGIAKHPHWRANADQRDRMNALPATAHKHT